MSFFIDYQPYKCSTNTLNKDRYWN